MMDTVLNLGINDDVVMKIVQITNNTRFAYGTYVIVQDRVLSNFH